MHIEHMMKKYPEFRVQYNARLAAIKKIDNEKEDKVRVMERMSEVEKVLDEVEKQLQSTGIKDMHNSEERKCILISVITAMLEYYKV